MEIAELQELCKKIVDKRAAVSDLKETYSTADAELDVMEMQLIAAMTENKLKNFRTDFGNFVIRQDLNIPIPKGDDKLKFYAHLQEIGQFEAMISVNSRTLNAWYKSEDAAAKDRGEPYAVIPGLEMPKMREILSVTKAK